MYIKTIFGGYTLKKHLLMKALFVAIIMASISICGVFAVGNGTDPYVSQMGFTSTDGSQISAIGDSKVIKGYVDIKNDYGVAKNNVGMFSVAGYIDGKLVSTNTITTSIDSNTTLQRISTKEIAVPATDEEITYKIMAWDSFKTMNPIFNATSLNQTAYALTVPYDFMDSAVMNNGIVTFECWASPTAIKTTKYTLPANAAVYINDALVTNLNITSALTNGAHYGEVSFAKNNSLTITDFDTVYITSYINCVVDSVDATTYSVVSKNYVPISFDPSDITVKSTLYDSQGNIMNFTDLKENDVLTCKISNANNKRTVIATLVKNTVTGKITEVMQDFMSKYTINGSIYTPDLSINNQLALGDKGTFYLDLFGNIAWFEMYYPEPKYAYVCAVSYDTAGIDGRTEVKLYTSKGEFVIYKTASKVKLDDVFVPSSDLTLTTAPYLTKGPVRQGQFITYDLNANNEINCINRSIINFGRTDVKGVFSQYSSTPLSEYTASTGTLTTGATTSKVYLTNKTVVMVATGSMNEEDYELINVASIADEQVFANVQFFDVNENREVGVVLINSPVTLSTAAVGMAAITGTSYGITENDDTINILKVLQNGVAASLNGSVDFWANPSLGSAVIPVLNSNKEIRAIEVLATPNTSTNTVAFTAYGSSKVNYFYGKVIERRNSILSISNGNGTDIVIPATANVYMFDERSRTSSNRVTLGSVTSFNAKIAIALDVSNGYATMVGDTIYESTGNQIASIYVIAREYDGIIKDVMLYIFK